MKRSIFVIFCILIVLMMTGCTNSNSYNLHTLPANFQGVYADSYRSKMGYYVTYAIKLESNYAWKKSFLASKISSDADFSEESEKYGIKLLSSSNGSAHFQLYQNSIAKYDCIADFGSLQCQTQSGTYLEYNKVVN